MMTVQQNMGTMPRRVLAFSTCVNLHSFHGFGVSGLSVSLVDVGWIAALSKNLHMEKKNMYLIKSQQPDSCCLRGLGGV